MPVVHKPIFGASPKDSYELDSERVLYLDTSIIRRLGRRLKTWEHRHRSYTSVLSIVELLNGIGKDVAEFRKRRSAIAGIFLAGIQIDWQMPELKLRCAFTRLRPKYDIFEKRTECIQEIIRCLRESKSADEFVLREANLRLMFPLRYFADYDEIMSRQTIESAAKWTPKFHESFAHESTAQWLRFVGLPPGASARELSARVDGSAFDYGTTIFAMTTKFAAEEGIVNEVEKEALFRSYDGSCSFYIRALASQQWRQVAWGDMPGRNAGVDFHHLIYLTPGVELVTVDRRMAAAASAAGATLAEGHLLLGGG